MLLDVARAKGKERLDVPYAITADDLDEAAEFGKVVVGTQMGPVPMAIYTTAAYQVPLVAIVQQSLSDVIFPDMVKRAR